MDTNIFTGATDSNWGTDTNWSRGAIPTSADGYIATFNASSPNCILGANRAAYYIDFTNYTGDINLGTYYLQVSSGTIFGSGMSVSGTGSFNLIQGNITSNGFMVPSLKIIGSGKTYTLLDDLNVVNLILNGVTIDVLNGNTIYIGGNLTQTSSATVSGTTNIIMNGTGTWSNASTGQLRNNLNITSSNVTISGVVRYNTGTLTITVPVIHNASYLQVISTGVLDINSAGEFGTVQQTGNNTVTLLSDINCVNLILGATTATTNFAGAYNIYVSGNYTINVTTGYVGGGNIIMTGNGTFAMPVLTAGSNRNNLTINTAGTIVFSGSITHITGTITRTAGTIDATGSTLKIPIGTLDLNGATLNNLNLIYSSNATLTLKSEVKIAGILSNSNSVATNDKIISDVGGTQRKLTMLAGSSQTITALDATDIDSSAGYPIITNGVINNSPNWYAELPNKMFLLF